MGRSAKPVEPAAPSVPAAPAGPNVGDRVRAHRKRAGLSLEQLARLSGVSKAMLSQIEQNKANPTVVVVCKISRALNVTISELVPDSAVRTRFDVIRRDDPRYLFCRNEKCTVRTLSPLWMEKDIEFYEVDLAPGGELASEAHFQSTEEFLTVTAGRVALRSADHEVTLREGDAAHYSADVVHSIANTGRGKAKVYLVVKYRTR